MAKTESTFKNMVLSLTFISFGAAACLGFVYEMTKEPVLFSDLFAERMVVLAWAGRKNHFNPLWIDILLEQQSSNGSWTEQEFPPYFSQERIQERIFHASGLAGLALQYYYEDKTLAHWFVKQ